MEKKNDSLKDLIARLQRFQKWRRGKIDSKKYEIDSKQIGLDIDAAINILKKVKKFIKD